MVNFLMYLLAPSSSTSSLVVIIVFRYHSLSLLLMPNFILKSGKTAVQIVQHFRNLHATICIVAIAGVA
jgi:hypothetical protein